MDPDSSELRRQAEERLAQRPALTQHDTADMARLLHELQVHQVELEMQNESLREMQAEAQDALQRYANLNDRLEEIVAMRTADLVTAREAAESASRAKSTFLANMSHELRTPMNAIMGMADLALRRATDPKQKDQLGKVMVSSQHLLGIINDVLDLSKIEAERLTLEKAAFNLAGVLSNLHCLLDYKASDKGLHLVVDAPEELTAQPLLGDPLRLGQILLNLAGNAIKFTAQGSIIVRVRLIEETVVYSLLRFEVQDHGIGIAIEDQQRLFNAFEQVDNSTTRRFGGSGLGLTISKRLVRMMGGSIGVDSALGVGSTFWFTTRLDKAASVSASLPLQSDAAVEELLSARHANARILLVEDDPINREVTTAMLEEVGLKIDLAEDGEIAVEMARRTDYDIILMDMQMPGMNGIEATLAIRAIPGRVLTPILAMTANAFEEDRQLCFDAGMDDFIGKPVFPAQLYGALLKWLSHRATA